MIWWVAYRRGSFSLKEGYRSAQHALERCGGLFTHAQFLRIVPGDDIEGCATLACCFELPPVCEPVRRI
ncbi:MAG TPA: hypothetical protein VGH23_10965 [Rhizomicrobium sp.]|jgi:hypothetical protein